MEHLTSRPRGFFYRGHESHSNRSDILPASPSRLHVCALSSSLCAWTELTLCLRCLAPCALPCSPGLLHDGPRHDRLVPQVWRVSVLRFSRARALWPVFFLVSGARTLVTTLFGPFLTAVPRASCVHGRYFPGTGAVTDIGVGKGKNYAVSCPSAAALCSVSVSCPVHCLACSCDCSLRAARSVLDLRPRSRPFAAQLR